MTKLGSLACCSLATFLLATVAGCSATTTDEVAEDGAKVVSKGAVTIDASTDPAQGILRFVSRVEEIRNPDGLTLRAYVGGDSKAAMNGRDVWLGVFGEGGAGYVFDVAPSVATVTKVEYVAPHGVRITGTRDKFDDAARTPTRAPFTIDIAYERETGKGVSPFVRYRDSDGRDWRTSCSPEGRPIGKILAVREAEQDGLTAKILETSAVTIAGSAQVKLEPKPATNGVHLVLTLDPGLLKSGGPDIVHDYFAYRTFDLDLDVSSVDAIAFVASTRLEIRGMKDVANAGGAAQRRPFAYAVSFTRSADGTPSASIELSSL